MTGKEKGMDLRKRWLAILTTMCMLASLAPTGVFAASSGSAASQAAAAENSAVSPVSAETYSDLGLSRDVSGEKLVNQKQQPYGNDVTGSVVATNVINELYVNFNGSIHYGWSILDEIPMQYRSGEKIGGEWQSPDNFYGAMGYWRPNQRTVKYSTGSKSVGALYAKDGNAPSGSPNSIGESISSNNKHLTNQYNLAEAFSPGTGKDNYVAQMRLDYKNDVYLEIYSVAKGKSGKYENKCVASVKAGEYGNDGSAGDKDHIIYNYEYDAMYDLATGDIDGDGYDEIALYFGNRVYLYSYKNSSLKRVYINDAASFLTIQPDNIGTVAPKFKSSIVTLAFGDINADGKDELAVAQTLPYTSGTGSEYVRILSTNKDGAVKRLTAIDDRNLGDGTLRYANVATGDINGDNVDELIIAGYVSTGGRNQVCSKNKIYYKVIDKNIIDSLVKDGNADIGSWKSVDFKLNEYLGRVVDNKNEMIPPVSLVCAATQGTGYADQVFMGGCLYSYDTSNDKLNYLTRMTMNREYKQDGGEKKNKEDMFVLNAVAGNFDGNAHGQEQIICALGMRAEDRDNYWYDIAYINKMYPGDSDASDETKYWYGQEQVMNFESSYNHDSNKDRASLYLSLAAVDCDDDSTLMRYKSKNVTYSKPEVYTVLQSAPYFKDLEENRGYLNQSETSYGKSSSDGTIITSGGKVTAGMYMSFSQDISVFGVKIASFEAEGQYTHTFSHEFDYEETVTESIAYSASAGDDYAVVYTVPYMDYQYQVWVPKSTVPSDNYEAWLTDFLKNSYGKNDNGSYKWDALTEAERNTAIAESKTVIKPGSTVGGYWDDCVISIPMKPKTVILTVDAYDEIAARTAGLEPIRGNVLNSEVGYPATYKYYSEYGSDSFRAIGQEQMVTNAEGSYITIEGSRETSYENEFKYDFDIEGRVGVGAGGMTVGVIGGFGFGVGGGVISSSSKSYSATVDNLPADASAYTFNWKFGTRKAKLNGNDLLILEYRTSNVQQLPSPPSDLRVESVTTDSVSLGWTGVPGAVNYRIYQIDKNTGMQFLMAAVPGSATSYTDDQLNPNTTYTYSIQSVMADNASSILTKEVTASTLSNSMSDFTIRKHPEDTSTFVSGNATFEVEAQCLGADGKPYTLHYQWQKYNENSREWEVCDMQENGYAQYTHKNVNISDAGTKYRCLVYVNAKLYIMSLPAELSIGRAKSSIAFSASSGGTDLTNGSSVKSSYTESQIRDVTDTEGNPQYNEVPVTEVIDSKTYTLYTYSTAGDGSGTVTLYNDGSGNYYIKDSSGTLSKLTISNEPQSLSYRETTGSGDAAVSTDKNVPWSSLVKDTAYTAGSKSFYVDGNGNVVASSTTGATSHKASEKYDVTENGAVTVSFYKCSITETIEDSSNTVTYESWFAVTGAGAGEKQYNAVLTTNDILKNGSVSIDIDDIKLKTEQQKITQTVDVQVNGDTVVMSAAVTGRQDRMPTGYITFSMSSADGTDIQKITATVGSDGKATAEWKPSVSGTYTLKAEYEGDDCFKASTSGTVTINVITPNERKLTLSGMNMTYGDEPQILQLIMLDGKVTGEVTSEVIKASNVSISYEGKSVYVYDILDSGIRFTPDKAGVYSITATYKDNGNVMTVTKNITVYKRNVTIVAVDKKTALGTAIAQNELEYKLKGMADKADEALFDNIVTLSCDGINADVKGQFPINVTFTASMSITEKYNVSVRAGTLNVVEDAYLVNNETTDTNGAVKLTYSVGNVTLDVKKGELVPKGAKVTATASPAEGYKVKCWYIKEGGSGSEYHPVYQGGSTGAFDTSNTLVISDSLDKEYSVKAEFELAYYRLEFDISDYKSTITAKYLSSAGTAGETFSSGSKVNPIQKIQLTAAPAGGKSIKEWRIYNNSTVDPDKYEIVKADDGVSNYTGNTYTVSGISADTKITVVTENESSQTVSITVKDTAGNDISANINGVKFNGDAAAAAAGSGKFTYAGKKHDNITVTLDIPESLIVASWKENAGSDSEKLITDGLSNQKKTYVISDLQSDMDITVTCDIPNSYIVYTGIRIYGASSASDGGAIKMYKSGTNTEIASGSSVLQSTMIRVVITVNEGYDLEKFIVNGKTVEVRSDGSTKEYYINGVSENIRIIAEFTKRPVITLKAECDGGGSAPGAVSAVQNGKNIASMAAEEAHASGTVTYQSTDDIVVTADPTDGYEAVGFTVERKDSTEPESYEGTVNNDDNSRIYNVLAGDYGFYEDITITAKFKKIPTYKIEHSVVDTNGSEDGGLNGSISVTASRKGIANSIESTTTSGAVTTENVYEGSDVTVKAVPDAGYRLKYLWVDDKEVTDAAAGGIYTLRSLDGNHTVKAQFDVIGNNIYYTADSSQGSVTAVRKVSDDADEKPFASGDSLFVGKLIFTASANDGYRIAGWTVNGVTQTDENGDAIKDSEFVYTVSDTDTGADIRVIFERSRYNVSFNIANSGAASDPDEGLWGTVSASGNNIENGGTAEATAGEGFTFKVTPDSEHMIGSVKINGVECATAAGSLDAQEITVPAVSDDTTIEVRFAEIPEYTVTVYIEGGGHVIHDTAEVISGGVINVKRGDTVTLTAQADEFNALYGWKKTGTDGYVSTSSTYTFRADGNSSITAVFGKPGAYDVSYRKPDPDKDGGTIASMTVENTEHTGKPGPDGKVEKDNISEGSKVVFKAEPAPGKCVENWTVKKKQNDQNSGKTRMMSVTAMDDSVSPADESDVVFIISDEGKMLTIPNLTESVEVSITFMDAIDYKIKSVKDAVITVGDTATGLGADDADGVTAKAPRWNSATVTVGNKYRLDQSKLKAAVGENAEYTVTNNSDGGVTVTLNNILGDIDTTSAFTKKPESTGGDGGGGGGGGGGAAAPAPAEKHTVKFVTGWFASPADQTVEDGKKAVKPEMSERGNYVLEGWYTEETLKNRYTFDEPVTANIMLFAKWKLKDEKHGCDMFTDMEQHWAKDAVCFSVENGLMNGVSKDTFSPDGRLSRGMLVTILWRADGESKAENVSASRFSDVSGGAWYADAVAWANANGIVTGYSAAADGKQRFGPDDSITREQLAVILYRYAKYKGIDTTQGGMAAREYDDFESVSSYAAEAVDWAVNAQLISGVNTTTLAPKGNATRAQTSVILKRLTEMAYPAYSRLVS